MSFLSKTILGTLLASATVAAPGHVTSRTRSGGLGNRQGFFLPRSRREPRTRAFGRGFGFERSAVHVDTVRSYHLQAKAGSMG
jgi:hypothetical protein